MNAYTTKEYTTFYIRLLAEHVALGLDVLVRHPLPTRRFGPTRWTPSAR